MATRKITRKVKIVEPDLANPTYTHEWSVEDNTNYASINDFYLTYNNVNYYFTKPNTIEIGDKFYFNINTKVLKLNEDTVSTSTTGSSNNELIFVPPHKWSDEYINIGANAQNVFLEDESTMQEFVNGTLQIYKTGLILQTTSPETFFDAYKGKEIWVDINETVPCFLNNEIFSLEQANYPYGFFFHINKFSGALYVGIPSIVPFGYDGISYSPRVKYGQYPNNGGTGWYIVLNKLYYQSEYIDEHFGHLEGDFVKKTGDTMTGPLTTTELTVGIRLGNNIVGENSTSLGKIYKATGENSVAEGYLTSASGNYSHAEGQQTIASGNYSHAEGSSQSIRTATLTVAYENETYTYTLNTDCEAGNYFILNNTIYTIASTLGTKPPVTITISPTDFKTIGNHSVQLVNTFNQLTASGKSSHAEGHCSTASGAYSHTEGSWSTASGESAHAEGAFTTASGDFSHAEGDYTIASGDFSHAEGRGTQTYGGAQHVEGTYNIIDTQSLSPTGNNYVHIVGNGNNATKSNAHTLDWSGNAWFAGDVYVGSTSGTNKDSGSKKLATEEYVETNGGKIDSISIDGRAQTIDANKNVNLTGLEKTFNKVTSLSNSSTNDQYPSAKAVYDEINTKISTVYKAKGTCTFANKPALNANNEGFVYNISDAFTTTSDFVEGAGKSYPAGTNIVVINNGTTASPSWKYDVLAGMTDLSGYVAKAGDTMTGTLKISSGDLKVVTGIIHGEDNGTASYTNHAIKLGHAQQDYCDFYEYGGIFNFYKSVNGTNTPLGKITTNGWEGKALLDTGSTAITQPIDTNNTTIATTAFVKSVTQNMITYGAAEPTGSFTAPAGSLYCVYA